MIMLGRGSTKRGAEMVCYVSSGSWKAKCDNVVFAGKQNSFVKMTTAAKDCCHIMPLYDAPSQK